MRQKVLLTIGGGLVAAALVVGAVAAFAGWGGGSASLGPGAMMGVPWTPPGAAGKTISIDQAQQAVQAALDRQGNRDLVIDEVMEFQDNFYAIVKEKSTGTGAFELLVDRSTGAGIPEPGPNMMWNTKYGMMAGQTGWMMGGGMMGTNFAGPMTVSAEQARQAAQRWLDQNQPGSTTEAPDAFHGYYTVHLVKEGKVTGMLSVNGYTGQVWYHTWHGAFIQVKDLGR
jgi:hypothetical protein